MGLVIGDHSDDCITCKLAVYLCRYPLILKCLLLFSTAFILCCLLEVMNKKTDF